jgi:sugar phosphate isomerase/epimerase
MDKNIRNFIKVGLIHFMAYPVVIKGEGPIAETLERIAQDDYFDAVEVTWIKDDAVRAEAKEIISTSAMEVYYGAQPRLLTTGNNPNAVNEAERLVALNNLKEGIDEAAEIGAKGFAFLSGKYEEATKDQAFDALVKTTVELCEYAKERGVPKVALEVFDYDVDKCSLIGPVELAKKYSEAVCGKVDNFGLMVDLSHLPLLRETAKESLVPIKDYIIHAHMGNAVVKEGLPAYGDAHPRFGFPNSANDVDELTEYLRVLMDIGYLKEGEPKVVSFEVKPFGDEDPELVIANAKRTLNRAWAKL